MASLQEGVAAKIRGNLAESLPLIRLQGAASAQREGNFWAWKNRCARIPSLLTAMDDRMDARIRFIISVIILGLLMTGPFVITAILIWASAQPAEQALLVS
jgi:hypothetical protein